MSLVRILGEEGGADKVPRRREMMFQRGLGAVGVAFKDSRVNLFMGGMVSSPMIDIRPLSAWIRKS